MRMDAEADSLTTLAQRLIDRCRADIGAAWVQLEAAWRSLGLVPKTLPGKAREAMPMRKPRALAKTSPLKLRKAGKIARRMIGQARPSSARPHGRL